MSNISEYVKGTCQEMCPIDEIKMREREGLLHKLEMLSGTENSRKPKADPSRMVKSFSRSAAGTKMSVARNLRPPDVLRRTISHLLHDVVTVEYLPWPIVYDFLVDRLRSVRQDMVIQNLSAADSISILQPIVKFHAYAAYKLCQCPISDFDPSLNKKHLQECLKRLLVLYDDCDHLQLKYNELVGDDADVVSWEDYGALFACDRPYFEAMYVILNLGDVEAVTRGLNLQKKWRSCPIVKTALQMSLSYFEGNWVRICRLMVELPALLACIAALHLPNIRRKSFQWMSVAYSSKNLGFSISHFKDLFLYSSVDDLMSDCRHFGIRYDETSGLLYFLKGTFGASKENPTPRRESFVDEQLCQCSIPSLMLDNF